VIEVLHLAVSEKCVEGAIYPTSFPVGRCRHCVSHTNQFLRSLRFAETF